MKNIKSLVFVLFLALLIGFQGSALAQTASSEATSVANISAAGSNVRWDLKTSSSGGTLTISAADGRVFQKEFKSGASIDFTLIDREGNRLPDGQYTYELRLNPVLSKLAKATLAAARGRDDDPEEVRASRKRATPPDQSLVQSGGFSIVNGAVIVAGAEEGRQRVVSKLSEQSPLPGLAPRIAVTKTQQHHPLLIATPDDVIPDDLIVQGSACVGLDCVNGEVFGFDTIRTKENNTRIQFDDTSAAGFPTNNWQIRANSSAAGGASFLGFVDQGATGNSETGTIVFEVDAGAPANSLKVSSTGRVGLRTATPVLDLHITTSDTPAQRLEQTNAGGFTAQTWDIAGNEANFFVRDVTGGSRLPFRIRPGAPTSSIDIDASGNVGIGTAGASRILTVVNTSATETGGALFVHTNGSEGVEFGFSGITKFATAANSDLRVNAKGTGNLVLQNTSTGRVGIATAAPTETLSVNGTASKPGGGSWAVFSDERLKIVKGNFSSGLKAVMALQPLRYEYKPNNALDIRSPGEHVGFVAQEVKKVIPEAVVASENGYLTVNNDPILWTMLNAIKEQQQQIVELKREVRQLRAASRRRR